MQVQIQNSTTDADQALSTSSRNSEKLLSERLNQIRMSMDFPSALSIRPEINRPPKIDYNVGEFLLMNARLNSTINLQRGIEALNLSKYFDFVKKKIIIVYLYWIYVDSQTESSQQTVMAKQDIIRTMRSIPQLFLARKKELNDSMCTNIAETVNT